MSTSRGTIIAICSTLLAFLVLGISGSAPEPTPVSAANVVTDNGLSPETEAAFQRALEAALRKSAASTLDAITAQDEVLARIDNNIAKIAAREAAVEEAAQVVAEEKEIVVKALAAAEAATKKAAAVKAAEQPVVVRRSSTIWNVEGNWNYTAEQLAIHLQDVHGLDVDGYGREDMKIMHDNLHNGYSATGGIATGGDDRGTRSVTQTRTYQRSSNSNNRGVLGSVIAAPFELLFGKKSSRRSSSGNYCPPRG